MSYVANIIQKEKKGREKEEEEKTESSLMDEHAIMKIK